MTARQAFALLPRRQLRGARRQRPVRVPIIARIVWADDGEEHVETVARSLRRGAGRSGHQIEPPRPAERGEL
jgi:hypothetical protein